MTLEALRFQLKKLDTGEWEWDKIDCCLTGEDADLEGCGQQGIELVSMDDKTVTFVVHGYKIFVGRDICLNSPDHFTLEQEHAAREAFLADAEAVVQGIPYPGEWDGEDWVFSFNEQMTTGLVTESLAPVFGHGSWIIDNEGTAVFIIATAHKALENWEFELMNADYTMDMLSGWIDAYGRACLPGQPSNEASWMGGDE